MARFLEKLRHLLAPEDQRRLAVVAGLAIIGMGFEMLGIGAIPMFLTLLVGDALDASTRMPVVLERIMSSKSGAGLLVYGAGALLVLFLLKSLYLAFVSKVQSAFIWNYQARLSHRVFQAKLRCAWIVFVGRNSADAIHSSTFQSIEIAQLVLRPVCILLTEIPVVIALLALLVWWEPVISLVAGSVILGSVALFLRFSRRILDRYARQLQAERAAMLQIVQDSMGGAKVVKILGREGHLSEAFLAVAGRHARAARIHQFMEETPRLFVEVASVLGIVVVAVLLVGQGRAAIGIIPTLGLLAVALVRLIPSFNRITVSFTSLRYGVESLDAVVAELREVEGARDLSQSESTRLRFTDSIRLERVSLAYEGSGGGVSDVTMEIRRGSVVGIVGESGSGKTTLVDLIVGLLQPAQGKVLVDGMDIREFPAEWRRHIGYVPQDVYLSDDTIRANIAFGLPRTDYNDVALRRAVQLAQLETMLRNLPQGLDTVVGERGARISGGQRQRIGIARALYNDPDLLIFDEATSALDMESEAAILETIAPLRGSKTIIIVAHRESTVRHCDVLFRLTAGRLVSQQIEIPSPFRA
jgi:ABC-type multidrug transport system fused ATPase/permease subunit